ncbi:MAG: hypothetical protein COA67_08850 [Lutibacter sp.]|nr:MAG: hypothetical protein COA67_08850 [Lutibacter sp.]
MSYSQDDDSMILLKDDESKLIKFENHYFEALKYKAIGNYTRAITELEKCQQLFSDDKSVVFEFSKNYFFLNKFVEAELYIQNALEKDSENYWFLEHAKKVSLKQFNYERAIEFQKKMVLKKPEKTEDLVLIYIQARKYKEAQRIIDELTSKKITSSKLEHYQETILRLLDQKTIKEKVNNTNNLSLEALKKSFEDNQQYTILKEILTQEITNNNFDILLNYSNKGLELFPAQPLNYLVNAKTLIHTKKYNEAIGVLNNGIDFVVDDTNLEIDFYEQLIICFEALNQGKEAKKYLDKVNRLKTNIHK